MLRPVHSPKFFTSLAGSPMSWCDVIMPTIGGFQSPPNGNYQPASLDNIKLTSQYIIPEN